MLAERSRCRKGWGAGTVWLSNLGRKCGEVGVGGKLRATSCKDPEDFSDVSSAATGLPRCERCNSAKATCALARNVCFVRTRLPWLQLRVCR